MAKDKTTYECSNCKANHSSWKGQCHFCKNWNTISEVEVAAKIYRLPKVSLKRKEENKKPDIDKDVLDKWFDARVKESLEKPFCENCGKNIGNQLNSKDLWVSRSSIAHIFPKRKMGGFPSVSCHELNWVLLCLDCHSEMDSNYEKARKMKIWEHVCRKARIFSHLIKEPRSKLPQELFVD